MQIVLKMLVRSAILIFLFILDDVYGRPSLDLDSDPRSVCYSLKCPTDTTMCGKRSEVSDVDISKLLVQVRCYDRNGIVLKTKNLTEDNPFGPNVYYKGSKFSAVVRLLPSHAKDESPENTFIQKNPEISSGPKSEVEDLNNK